MSNKSIIKRFTDYNSKNVGTRVFSARYIFDVFNKVAQEMENKLGFKKTHQSQTTHTINQVKVASSYYENFS